MEKYTRVVHILAGATTRADYNRAKRLAATCSVAEQWTLVDHFISAARRLGGRQ